MRVQQPVYRLAIGVALLMSLLVARSEFANAAAPEAKRPNILFAFADDWGRYASAYAKLEPGGPSDIVSTPNFDRIASEGVLFRNAFVNAPSCTPCRSSLLSGQYFWRTGRAAILQGAVWDGSVPSYPLVLNEKGYHIGHTYKVWSPGTPANAPYGAAEFAYNKRGSKFNSFSQQVNGADDIEQAKRSLLEEVRGNFKDFLAAREDGEPLCYWFGPTNCHRKWIQGSGRELWGLEPNDLKGKMPSFLPDVPVVREDFADYLGEAMAFDAALGVLIEELDRIGELDNTMIAVSGDHGIPGFPNGKCNLYDFGTAVPLAIRWPGKAPAGRVVDDFVCLPDLAPTFLEAAGEKPLDVMTGRSLVSVLASTKSGQVDKSRDAVIVGRERHVAAARTGNMPYPQRAIRTKDFLYIRNFKPDRWPMGTGPGYGAPAAPMPSLNILTNNTFAAFGDLDASPTKAWIAMHPKSADGRFFDIAFGLRPAEELFDLRTDPHQTTNLADDEKYASVRKELSARLMKVLKETGDPRVTGDGTTFDKPPFSGEWKRPQRKPPRKPKKK
jgi:N-sulfoglucosamine sulfohydrolase